MRVPARWIGYGIGAIAIGLLGWWLWRPAVVPVDLAEVTSGPLVGMIEEEGETTVRDRFVVAVPISGRLERIGVQPGDSVGAGTALARIAPAPLDPRTRRELAARLEAAIDAERTARADVARTLAAQEQTSRERARMDRLHQQEVIAAEARERSVLAETAARREHEAADYRAQAAAHEVELARAALSSSSDGDRRGTIIVKAPVAGRVLTLLEQSERVVPAGTPVVEIGNPGALDVTISLLSTDAVKVAVGDTMLLTGWGRDDSLRAVVSRVEPAAFTKVSALGVEEQRVRVIGAIIDPPAALGDRFRIEAAIVTWRIPTAIRVPRTALFRVDDAWHTFIALGGRAAERRVEIGRQGVDQAEVRSGLEPGDRVILHPDERVTSGVRIEPRDRQR